MLESAGDPPPLAPPPRPRLGFWGVLDAIFIVVGYASSLGNAMAMCVGRGSARSLAALPLAVAFGVALARRGGRPALRLAREVFVLGVLVVWGLVLNHLAVDRCRVTSCELEGNVLRPLAEPQVFALLPLYVATVLAYAVSRRRPEALHPRVEVLVHAGLLLGIALQFLLGVHFARAVPMALFLPLTFPVLAPYLALGLLVPQSLERLRRRGAEALATQLPAELSTAYRMPGPVPVPGRPAVHGPTLARALGLASALAGLHAVLQALWLHRAGAALEAFTATCGYALSRIPKEVVPHDCHYLCTVAARGHPWLVRPERLGLRHGRVVLVNRQLAVANAFEDLLHERWPRLGGAARRLYDRVGLPLSGLVRHRLVADLVFLLMKPAEWCFLFALLLLDPRSPETRIARMYR